MSQITVLEVEPVEVTELAQLAREIEVWLCDPEGAAPDAVLDVTRVGIKVYER